MAVKKKEDLPTFAKSDLVKSQKYKNLRDVLHSVLHDNKMYTIAEVDKLIKSFLNKEVK